MAELASDPPQALSPEGPAPAPAPKRRRRWMVAAVVAVLVVAIAGGGAALFLGTKSRGEQVAAAMDGLDRCVLPLAELADEMAAYEAAASTTDGAAELTALSEQASLKLEESRERLAGATRDIDALEDSPAKDALVEGAKEASAALASLGDVVSETGRMARLVGLMDSVFAEEEAAYDLLDIAIDDADEEKWAKVESGAKAADARFVKAQAKLSEIASAFPEFETAQWETRLASQREQARIMTSIAGHGRSGSYSKYDDAADRYNDIGREVDDLDLPEWVDDPDVLFGDLFTALTEFVEHSAAVDTALTRAEERYASGQY